ncbi:hypothetical protein CJ010_15615 [Azoarcus sp. DD4]|uniref:bifunctional diguanylate cyclase/phosphodiesterase n=1 Tax=Azoarcus sp. DD4 TaxID=2027405 RepID=UPI00112685B2|nr:EAL domain-containing protein [Azoarcus sp. DD4]QDF97857.1 hypothetical protein CJ010_15615 [Azoarcus sp. DD4]
MKQAPRSFTHALVLNATGLVIVLVAAFLVAMVWQGVSSTREAEERDVARALERAVERLQILIRAAEMTADSAARAAGNPTVTGATLQAVLEKSLAAFEQRPELSYLGIALAEHGEYGNLERTADGRILLWLHPGARPTDPVTRNHLLTDTGFKPHEQRDPDGYDPRVRPFYRAALDAPVEGRWLPAYQWIVHGGGSTPLWGFSYVRPLRDHAGQLIGVLDADLDIPALNRFLAAIAAEYAVELQVVELGGTPSLIGARQVGSAPLPVPDELGTLIGGGVDGFVGRVQWQDEDRWAATRQLTLPGGPTWLIVASRPATLIDAPLRKQLYQVAGMGLAMLLGLVLISVRMARRFGRPLAELERSVARIEQLDSRAPLVIPPLSDGFRETRRLGEALGRMATALRQREEQLAIQNVQLLEAKEQQLASLALKGAVFDSTDTAILSLDHDLAVIEWNAAAERLFALRRDETGRAVAEKLCAPDGPADWSAILARTEPGIFQLTGAQGVFEAELRVIALHRDGRPIHTLFINDVSARRNAERRLRHLATHDALTDLPNRHLLQERLEQAIACSDRSGRSLALLLLDLDRFKIINDAYGHPFGDEVLKVIGARLVSLLRPNDTVARHGGDQFLILLTDLHDSTDADLSACQIIERLRQPITLEGREIHLSGSIGLSVFPQDCDTADALIINADLAMYRAKSLGRNTFQGFTQELSRDTQRRVSLETCLRGAAAAGQLQLLYQPKVSLQSGAIVGCEALLRWHHPELGMVPPSHFIPVAEDSGLIIPISDWVLRTACLQAKAWSDAGLPPTTVAVNISARQLLQQDLAAWTADMLRETGLAPELLELELTESLIAQDVEKMIATFGRLKAAGVKLSIDDFGTGYSSLAYLKHFRVDALKIDQSFVRNMLTQTEDATIVRAVIALAHNLKFKVIAEGVETAEQCGLLREHRCDEIQGYYFSKPVSAEAFAALLRRDLRLTLDSVL